MLADARNGYVSSFDVRVGTKLNMDWVQGLSKTTKHLYHRYCNSISTHININ